MCVRRNRIESRPRQAWAWHPTRHSESGTALSGQPRKVLIDQAKYGLPAGRGHIVDYGFDIAIDDLGEHRTILLALPRDFRDRCEVGWTWPGHNSAYVSDQVWIDARYQGEQRGVTPSPAYR